MRMHKQMAEWQVASVPSSAAAPAFRGLTSLQGRTQCDTALMVGIVYGEARACQRVPSCAVGKLRSRSQTRALNPGGNVGEPLTPSVPGSWTYAHLH